ncbi:hypothetical protein EDC01DRAFT_480163 [Geopyxis carbonaria]|nr:hypothetical protein EDC01DRAFT_480163 [Geopyxis carbonaria]
MKFAAGGSGGCSAWRWRRSKGWRRALVVVYLVVAVELVLGGGRDSLIGKQVALYIHTGGNIPKSEHHPAKHDNQDWFNHSETIGDCFHYRNFVRAARVDPTHACTRCAVLRSPAQKTLCMAHLLRAPKPLHHIHINK